MRDIKNLYSLRSIENILLDCCHKKSGCPIAKLIFWNLSPIAATPPATSRLIVGKRWNLVVQVPRRCLEFDETNDRGSQTDFVERRYALCNSQVRYIAAVHQSEFVEGRLNIPTRHQRRSGEPLAPPLDWIGLCGRSNRFDARRACPGNQMRQLVEQCEYSRRLIPCCIDRNHRSQIVPKRETAARLFADREEEDQMTSSLKGVTPFIEGDRGA